MNAMSLVSLAQRPLEDTELHATPRGTILQTDSPAITHDDCNVEARQPNSTSSAPVRAKGWQSNRRRLDRG
jgi:hypothetical protein